MADRAIVERARGGDAAAFEALAHAHSRRLFLVAHRILRDTEAAEDVLQQTLTTMWRELPRLRDTERFEAWTYRIVLRAAFAESERYRRVRAVAEVSPPPEPVADETSRIHDRDAIARAFDVLSPDRRAVVVLRYFADLPMRDIGYALGVPEGTVRSRLNRALADMRSAMRRDAALAGSRSTTAAAQPAGEARR